MKIKIDQIYGLIDDIIMAKEEKEVETLIFDKIGDESLRITLPNGEIFYISKEGKTTVYAS